MVPHEARPPIHASNAWNPTGRNLLPVPGCRLYYVHLETLSGPHTQVFLGSQRALTFVADLPEEVPPERVRQALVEGQGLYPHLVDLRVAEGLPVVFDDDR